MAVTINRPRPSMWRPRNIVLAVVIVVAIVVAVAAYRTYQIYESELPSFEQLHNIEPSLKTKVYDRNGILLKEFFTENRVLTPHKELPPHLPDMLVATEDRAYYDHWGIDLRRVVIVALTNLVKWRIEAGASTITQQLSRMLFLDRRQTLERKIKEALTAIKLERTYSKNEILEMYINQYYFSRGAYGIAAAANMFFSKKPPELDVHECAIIIGLLKGPNINSPLNNPEKSIQARNRVLYSFYEWGGISREEFDSLRNEPLAVNPPQEKLGTAPYFTETIRQYIYDKYGETTLYSGGLKVLTSLDVGLQEAGEAALYKKIDSLRLRTEQRYPTDDRNYTELVPDTTTPQPDDSIRVYKKVQGAFVAIDNANGDILAMVGGRSFERTEFNRAVQSNLQPGSAFKPFIYTACVDNGFRPTDIVDDNPIVLDIPGAKQWRPHNFDSKFMGPITLRDALRMSRNLVSVRLLLKIQPEQPVFYARRMGLTTPLTPVPSLALGVGEVKLIELVSAYSTFPNRGIHIPYRMIHKIVDRYGRVLEDNTAVQKEEVLSEQTAYIMVSMMQSVVKAGTGQRSQWLGFTRPAGGKTGTSDNFCDNWFIGYTPQITAGCWVGFDEKLSLGRNQDGAKNGVPVWTEFMIAAHDSLPIVDFAEPEGIVHLDICLESGELATDRCEQVRNDIFTTDNQPTRACHIHPSKGLYISNSSRHEDRQSKDSTEGPIRF